MNHRVYLGIGSNIDPGVNIARGLDEIAGAFRLAAISSVYQSAAVGFEGAPFLNCVAEIEAPLGLPALAARLRTIECRYGRTPNSSKFSSRQLDIDILSYDLLMGEHHGIHLPRDEITINAYVLCPFAEIAGTLCIPGQTQTLAELWSAYDRQRQPLTRVSFAWHDRSLPAAQMHCESRSVVAN